jgi:hypothetical protein
MKSLKETIQKAEPIVGRISYPITVRALAKRFQFQSLPISLKTLMETQPKPEQLVLESGKVHAGTVGGWAQLGISSDGFWSFRGHVHEDGFVGNNYALTITLEFIDSSSNVPIFLQEGVVGGTVNPFDSRDEDWQQDGQNSIFNQNWETIRNQGIRTNLHVDTDPLQVVETILWPLVAVAAAVGYILILSDSDTTCEWQFSQDSTGGAGYGYKCHRDLP